MNPVENHEFISKLLEEGRYRKYILEKVIEKNHTYINEEVFTPLHF